VKWAKSAFRIWIGSPAVSLVLYW